MNFKVGFAWLMMIVACIHGAQAGPPPQSEENLSPQCRTPKCPENSNANLTYPMDCLLYVECHQGEAKIKACPSAYHFNEATGNCTHRDTANCVNCWQKAPTR